MSKEITMTKDGGFYYRAVAVHWILTALTLPIFLVALVIAVCNPFWFREDFMRYLERTTMSVARKRDKLKYRVYLGTDPDVWHALKDEK